jgi:hypothetical protein
LVAAVRDYQLLEQAAASGKKIMICSEQTKPLWSQEQIR